MRAERVARGEGRTQRIGGAEKMARKEGRTRRIGGAEMRLLLYIVMTPDYAETEP